MTRARATVIVVSSSAKSYFFRPPTRIVANGALRYWTLGTPMAFAISLASEYSKPDPFLIVVPDTRPFQNPGAGTSKPTISFPDSFVGGAEVCAEAATAVAAAIASAAAASAMRFTRDLLVRVAS